MDDLAAERTRRLAAGLAHDINNLLNAFVGYGELLRTGLAGDPDLLPYAEGIVDACRRGTRLSHQLAVLGGRVRARLRPFDLAPVVAARAEPDAEVPVEVAPLAEARVVGDPALLADALQLAIEHVRRCWPHGHRLRLVLPPGSCAIELHLGAALPAGTDCNGCWDPFAPLRPGGRGSLMLAAARRLVELSGGSCSLGADADGGILRFVLPDPVCLLLHGRQVALVVADEELRLQLEDALGAAGAWVRSASSLAEAERVQAALAAAPAQILVSDQAPLPGSLLAALRRWPAGAAPDVVAAIASGS